MPPSIVPVFMRGLRMLLVSFLVCLLWGAFVEAASLLPHSVTCGRGRKAIMRGEFFRCLAEASKRWRGREEVPSRGRAGESEEAVADKESLAGKCVVS